MIIKELYVKSFGKLQDLKLALGDGLNIVFGPNESGKSTLIAFIRAMLYGLSEKKNRTPDRVAYMPWDGSQCEGYMVVADGERKIMIHRKFDRESYRRDFCQISDMIKGKELDLKGEDITGLTSNAFDNTVFIRQLSVTKVSDDTGDLYNKLVNLVHTGQEDVNASSALSYLESRIKELSSRRKDVSINSLMEQKGSLERELNELIRQHRLMMQDESRLLELKEQLKRLEEEIARLDELKPVAVVIGEYRGQLARLRSEIETLSGEIKELEDSSLKKERDELNKRQREVNRLLSGKADDLNGALRRFSVYRAYLVLGTVLAAIGLVAVFFNPLSFVVAAAGIVLTVVGYRWKGRYLRLAQLISEIDEIKSRLSEMQSRVDRLRFAKEERENSAKQLQRRVESLMSQFLTYARECRISDIVDSGEDLNGLINKVMGQKAEEKEKVIGQIASIQERWKDCEVFKRIPELKQEIALLDERLNKMNFEYRACKLAYDVMSSCLEEINTDFAPSLVRRAGEAIKSITGKYEKVGIDSDDFKLSVVVPEYSVFKSPFELSGGTADQIYLGFRIALADMVSCDKNPPLILDDALVQYDDQRLENALGFLVEYGKKRQVILFTCHKREIDVVEKLNGGSVSIIRI